MTARYQELYDLIRPYVLGDENEVDGHTLLTSDGDFDTALNDLMFLINHVNSRYAEAEEYVESKR